MRLSVPVFPDMPPIYMLYSSCYMRFHGLLTYIVYQPTPYSTPLALTVRRYSLLYAMFSSTK